MHMKEIPSVSSTKKLCIDKVHNFLGKNKFLFYKIEILEKKINLSWDYAKMSEAY